MLITSIRITAQFSICGASTCMVQLASWNLKRRSGPCRQRVDVLPGLGISFEDLVLQASRSVPKYDRIMPIATRTAWPRTMDHRWTFCAISYLSRTSSSDGSRRKKRAQGYHNHQSIQGPEGTGQSPLRSPNCTLSGTKTVWMTNAEMQRWFRTPDAGYFRDLKTPMAMVR